MRNEKLKQAFSKIKQEITELKNQLSRIEETEENKKKEKTIVAASGYFDPVHLGHVEYLEKAKKLAEKINGKLVVIVNSDEQAIMKKGYVFMPQKERISIINSLKCVDLAVLSIDRDETVRESLRFLKPKIYKLCSRLLTI